MEGGHCSFEEVFLVLLLWVVSLACKDGRLVGISSQTDGSSPRLLLDIYPVVGWWGQRNRWRTDKEIDQIHNTIVCVVCSMPFTNDACWNGPVRMNSERLMLAVVSCRYVHWLASLGTTHWKATMLVILKVDCFLDR